MARLLADEQYPLEATQRLRQLGHDVRTLQDIGKANQRVPDSEVLALASADNRAVLTRDRDFKDLHYSSSKHQGIVFCTEDKDYARQANHIHAALIENPDVRDKLMPVYRDLEHTLKVAREQKSLVAAKPSDKDLIDKYSHKLSDKPQDKENLPRSLEQNKPAEKPQEKSAAPSGSIHPLIAKYGPAPDPAKDKEKPKDKGLEKDDR